MVRRLMSDAQWTKIEHLLPGKASDPGRTAADNRLFVEAVLWIARTGAPWRDLPSEFGRWERTYMRFSRWSRKGVWERVVHALAGEADLQQMFIDSTIVRAHQHSAGAQKKAGPQALGRSRGGLSTKLHVAVDALGNPLRVILSAGQVADIDCAPELIADLAAQAIIADKGYDSDAFVQQIEASGAQAVIPPRVNRRNPRPFDPQPYRCRNLIECFFSRIKHFRRLATRYDKLARNFMAFAQLACAFAPSFDC